MTKTTCWFLSEAVQWLWPKCSQHTLCVNVIQLMHATLRNLHSPSMLDWNGNWLRAA